MVAGHERKRSICLLLLSTMLNAAEKENCREWESGEVGCGVWGVGRIHQNNLLSPEY
ncbi:MULTISPECIES: hypothetical protein [unclassified Microcystis]|uniref:hypothetical protein n=1 Tax=unclassified Microcystis TaxID=2643300 RepID=UPI00258F2A6D|nr:MULTISPECIES: hypothetical protein [unclassified Microcystis]MCA2563648.1 hypothetical protein [Microcystis sp. M40BS1]MCA2585651.1 hypothetical protein [Microcystis sp. M34BS1]